MYCTKVALSYVGVAISLEGRSQLIASRVHDLCQNAKVEHSETQAPSGGRKNVSSKIVCTCVNPVRGRCTRAYTCTYMYVNQAKRVKPQRLLIKKDINTTQPSSSEKKLWDSNDLPLALPSTR